MLFFFVKQKTAYEMRISDWSSDVCSSDLHPACGAIEPVIDPTRIRPAKFRWRRMGRQRRNQGVPHQVEDLREPGVQDFAMVTKPFGNGVLERIDLVKIEPRKAMAYGRQHAWSRQFLTPGIEQRSPGMRLKLPVQIGRAHV